MTPRAAGGLDEAADGVDLGAHRPGREVAVGGVGAQLGDRHAAERLRVGLAPADDGVGHVGGDDEHVGTGGVGEQGGAEVLVDDGLDTGERTVGTAYVRDASTTVGHHDEAGLDQCEDRRGVEDLPRLGRGDDAAPALLAAVLPGLAVAHQELRLGLGEVPADRLGGRREALVVGVDERARHDRGAAAVDGPAGELAVERVHQHEAEGGLRLRTAPVQRDRRYDGGSQLVLHQEVADLGAVAVGDDDVVVVLEEARDRRHRDLGGGDLVLRARPPVGVRHGVAAECEQDPHGATVVSALTATPRQIRPTKRHFAGNT